jgi:peptidyl-prolyl cis-trans isomerase C
MNRHSSVAMGLFDGLKKAFVNEEFKEDDQRVRCRHILIKGDDDVDRRASRCPCAPALLHTLTDTCCGLPGFLCRVVALMGEIGQRMGSDATQLGPIFAEVARRESMCSSKAQGGDLGLFGPGKMVPEFDAALFPETNPPPAGAMLGPIVTEFGCHAILVTKREVNRDQIEEKLARND